MDRAVEQGLSCCPQSTAGVCGKQSTEQLQMLPPTYVAAVNSKKLLMQV